jgi:Ca2+-binding RTX toxin-like protein
MALVEGGSGADTLDGTIGNDTVKGYNGNDTLNGLDGDDILDGGAGNDVLNAGIGEDVLLGGIGLDTLAGGSGNNRLDGGAGADSMTGGTGDDTYVVDSAGDVVVEAFGEGTDMVESSVSYTLSADIENLTLTGIGAINGTGNALDNTITGNSGANRLTGLGGSDTLDGGVGADNMTGGIGDDVYIVDNRTDHVTELAGEGTDEVRSFVSYVLEANADVEILSLQGASLINATGNALDNTLTGNAQANTLDGGAGADVMEGGAGNDTYIVDNVGDTANDSGGTDTVRSGIVFDLNLGAIGVENLTLTGTGAINGFGTAGENVLTGNTAANTLDGRAGNDTIDGGKGIDLMIGGDGNDTYYVDAGTDQISENAGEGLDTVISSVTYNIGLFGDEVEGLTLTGTAALNGTGGAGDNVITGNKGSNTLTGAGGNDTLDGGTGGTDTLIGNDGDDVYIINAVTGKIVVEQAGEGTDEVRATVSYTLGAQLENLVLLGTANINGTGNALNNTITGNTGNNTLTGGAGVDTLVGLGGNDLFFVDNVNDVVNGTGTVSSSVDWDLTVNTTGANNLILTGAAVAGYGNAAENTIIGTAGANDLRGGGGGDVIYADANDSVDGGIGNDTAVVAFSASTTNFGWTEIENITLTGTALLNATGDGNDNILTGNSAKNTLDGGLGNDTYVITTGDVIIDADGNDTVRVGATYTLLAGMENITLTGTGNFNATGDAGVNILTGNSGKNTLDGRGGVDTLIGGLGDDTYVVDGSGAIVSENAGQGRDTVRTAFDHVLEADVEILVLTGTAAVNGTGNADNNTLTGNSAANTLDGGAGADLMMGGGGNDVFMVDNADDRVTDTSGNDTVFATDVSFTLGLNIENLTLLGVGNTNATGNNLRNVLTGGDGNNSLDGGGGVDTMAGGLGNDTYIVDAAGDVVIEDIGGGTDKVISSVSYTLGHDVENLTMTGSLVTIGTGNALGNVIDGSQANNFLYGRDGDDTIDGGFGNDILYGELGNDTLAGGEGIDTMYGGDGADYFHFDASALSAVDVVRDYSLSQGDVVDVADVLTGYTPGTDDINDFLRLSGSSVQVDMDGTGTDAGWVTIAILSGIHPVLNQTVVTFLVPT